MDNINVLHLSDIHFAEHDEYSNSRFESLIGSLIDYFKDKNGRSSLADFDKWKPDLVFVTGDLTYSASDEQYRKVKKWLLLLLKTLELTADDLFVCPGNHDVNRPVLREILPQEFDAQRRYNLWKDMFFNLEKDKFAKFADEYFGNYTRFCKNLKCNKFERMKHIPSNKVTGYKFHERTKTNVLVFNSSWFCTGYKPTRDRGELYIGKNIVDEVIPNHIKPHFHQDRKDDQGLTISLIHHPPSWLNWTERYSRGPFLKTPYDEIVAHSDIILSGHEHSLTNPADMINNYAQLFVSGASNLRHKYDRHIPLDYNSFNLLQIDKVSRTVNKREFIYDNNDGTKGEWSEAVPKQSDKPKFNGVFALCNGDMSRENNRLLLKSIEIGLSYNRAQEALVRSGAPPETFSDEISRPDDGGNVRVETDESLDKRFLKE